MTGILDRPATHVPPVDLYRLDELARKLYWLAQVETVLITGPAELDPCSVCPEPRSDDEDGPLPSDAVIVYRRTQGGFEYREPVCVAHLTDAVRTIGATTILALRVEVPAVVTA